MLLTALRYDLVVEVGAVEGVNEYVGFVQCKVLYNIILHLWGGRGCKGDDGQVGIYHIDHVAELAVFRPEIVSPFRDTVRFIYGNKGDIEVGEESNVFLLGKGFGRHIQHLGDAFGEVGLYFFLLCLAEC